MAAGAPWGAGGLPHQPGRQQRVGMPGEGGSCLPFRGAGCLRRGQRRLCLQLRVRPVLPGERTLSPALFLCVVSRQVATPEHAVQRFLRRAEEQVETGDGPGFRDEASSDEDSDPAYKPVYALWADRGAPAGSQARKGRGAGSNKPTRKRKLQARLQDRLRDPAGGPRAAHPWEGYGGAAENVYIVCRGASSGRCSQSPSWQLWACRPCQR